MSIPNNPLSILDRIIQGQATEAEFKALRQLLSTGESQNMVQFGKYNINLGKGQGDIHIGDRIYQGPDAEAIRDIVRSVLWELPSSPPPKPPDPKSVDELVQEVRSRLHDDIQALHDTMPLWGVDHWVPLGELFVDVNILEEVSSNHRSELADLWQDFSQNPGYRGLDRMGLGKKRQRVSGLEVLDRDNNLMVVGKPGSGKTTYLQRVVTECNAGNLQAQRIPVLIKLREFVEDGREVGYLVRRYLERYWRLSAGEVQSVLKAGQSLVLMDGLDEVTGADGQEIDKQIKLFARDYPQVQVIITCRTQSQESRFERFDYVEVADFDELQIRAFAAHWFQAVCGNLITGHAKATAFLEHLFREENKPIRELAITPILLSLTCAVFQQTGQFYSKRSRLYEEGIELLLEQWDKSREIERDKIYRDLSVERKLELLSYLAVKKFEQEQYVLFEQAEIEGYIAEFLGIGQRESRSVLKAIESQHGLLIERSQKVWSFSHLTFQEYLTAKWLCDRAAWKELSTHLMKNSWQEIFMLTSNIINNPDDFNEFIVHIWKEIGEYKVKDEIIKYFFDWLSGKISQVKTSYKSIKVKTIYCLNEFDYLFKADKPTESLIEPLKSLSDTLNIDLDRIIFNLIYDKVAIEEYDLSLDRALIVIHSIFSELKLAQDEQDTLLEYLHDTLEGAIKLTSSSIHHADMRRELRILKQLCPASYSDYRLWLSSNDHEKCMVGIRHLMTYRKIGREWKFTKHQVQWLNQYFYASLILMKCIGASDYVSHPVQEEVNLNFLMPV